MYSDEKKLADVINFGALWLQTNELDDTWGFFYANYRRTTQILQFMNAAYM